jgi:hypothetical protein
VKTPRVGDERRVDALGDLARDAHADGLAEVVDHLADGRGRRVDPVDAAEGRGRRVVVDVDDEVLLDVQEAGTVNVRAFDDEDGVVRAVHARRDADGLRAGSLA